MNRGQSLFEVVVALAISALIVIAITSLVSTSVKNASFSRNNTQASFHAEAAVEWLRSERDNNINDFLNRIQIPSYCMVDLSWNLTRACTSTDFIVGTPFIRQISFTENLVSGKTQVTALVKITWTDSQGSHEVDSTTYFTDWRQR